MNNTAIVADKFAAERTIRPGMPEICGASHSVFESHPKEVAQLIIDAAKSMQ